MKWLRRIVAALAILVVAIVAAGWLWLRASLPVLDGEITVAGANGPIEILRDAHGVPHVYAESEADAYFGLGFVHAQDRLWQMELARRAAAGRLAELFGPRAIPHDQYFRTLDFAGVAERNLKHVLESAQSLIGAYSAGVNAALGVWDGPWPIEIALFGAEPEPWLPHHSILAIKMMAVQLSGNASEEAFRWALSDRLTPEQLATLWPDNADGAPRPEGHAAAPNVELAERTLAALPVPAPSHVGSNNWVVAAHRSKTGAPILANDPHLGLTVPATWYLAHLSAPGLDVIGGTIPGIPAIVVGRNAQVAWGVTNTGPDVQDLFVVTDDDVIEERTVQIAMRGAESVAHTVRRTRYGPIVSDAGLPYDRMAARSGQSIALSWTALADDDTSIAAGFGLARSASLDDAVEAARDFHGPQQNFAMADVAGAIGFVSAGRVPVRRDHDGWLPADASTGNGDWTGHIPFEALPQARDPASGAIMTANQRVTPEDYDYFITRDWDIGYRAQRIAYLLGASEKHDVDGFAAMQTDTLSAMAREFLPIMLKVEAPDDQTAVLHQMLAEWDGHMIAHRPEPLIFQAWYRALVRRVLQDELGANFPRYYGRRPATMRRVLGGETTWCDDQSTETEESCEQQIGAALSEANTWLVETYGDDPTAWRWGTAHKAVSRHAIFSSTPVVKRLFEIVREHGGGPYTVMQANTRIANEREPFRESHGASLRTIFDLRDADSTRAIVHTGQSGHVLSPYYADLADKWVVGEYLTLPMTRGAVETQAAHRLVLTPTP